MKANGTVDFGWLLNLRIGSDRLIMEVGDTGHFAENESLWRKVVKSLRVTPALAE